MKCYVAPVLVALLLIQTTACSQELEALAGANEAKELPQFYDSSSEVSLASFNESGEVGLADFESPTFLGQPVETTADLSATLLKANTAQNGMQLACIQLFAIFALLGSVLLAGIYLRYRAIDRAEYVRENWG